MEIYGCTDCLSVSGPGFYQWCGFAPFKRADCCQQLCQPRAKRARGKGASVFGLREEESAALSVRALFNFCGYQCVLNL